MLKMANKIQDESTAKIFAALKKGFPTVPNDPDQVVYRYNTVSIRVRIVSPKFRGKSMAKHEEIVKRVLQSLPDEVTEDILMLMMLTPAEAKSPTGAYREFDEPTAYL